MKKITRECVGEYCRGWGASPRTCESRWSLSYAFFFRLVKTLGKCPLPFKKKKNPMLRVWFGLPKYCWPLSCWSLSYDGWLHFTYELWRVVLFKYNTQIYCQLVMIKSPLFLRHKILWILYKILKKIKHPCKVKVLAGMFTE